MRNSILGIDPGKSGGLAVLTEQGPYAYRMPDTEKDIAELVHEINVLARASGAPLMGYLEKVRAVPGSHGHGQFKFGWGYGYLRGCLVCSKIPFDDVHSKKWQKAHCILYPKGASDTEKKNITKAKAQQLFPETTITHAIADALLIAEYGRRLNGP